MPRSVPFLVLLILLPLTLHAQFPIAAPQKRPASGIQRSPVVAASGEDFLAAWEDGRAYQYGAFTNWIGHESDIYATRIALDGTAFSDGGVPVNPSASYERHPAVLWNGSQYVAIHDVQPQSAGGEGGGVAFTKIFPDRLSEKRVLPVSFGSVGRLKAAWNGSRYLVVRETFTAVDARVKGFLVSADLELASAEFEVAAPWSNNPDVASDGSSFLVAWLAEMDGGDVEVRVAVISNEGTISGDRLIARFKRDITLPLTPPSIAWNGTSYLVVWSDAASISARHVDSEGNPEPDTLTIARSQGVEVTAPDVAWNGAMYLVVFSYRNEWATPMSFPTTNLYAARLSPGGTLLDSPYPLTISATPGGDEASAVAASGNTFIVVLEKNFDVRSVIVDAADGVVGPLQLVSRSVWAQSAAKGVFDGSNLGFTWQESNSFPGEEPIVLFGRATPDGRHLDAGGIEIGRGWAGPLAVGSVYFATWQPWNDAARGVRITLEGEVIDPEPLRMPSINGVMATDGQRFLYAGAVGVRSADDTYVRLTPRVWTVGASGAISEPREVIQPAEFDQVTVDVAWSGSRYLLLYNQFLGRRDCHRCFPQHELRMVMLDRDGRPLSEPAVVDWSASGLVAGGTDRFIVISGGLTQNQYRIVGNGTETIATGVIGFEPVDAVWEGNLFSVLGYRVLWQNGRARYTTSIQRIDRNGSTLSVTTGSALYRPIDWRLIPAGGALAVLTTKVERFTDAHDAGLLRYQFSWLEQRRRAVAR